MSQQMESACCFKTHIGPQNKNSKEASDNDCARCEDCCVDGPEDEANVTPSLAEGQSKPFERPPCLQSAHLARVPSASKVRSDLQETYQVENACLKSINAQLSQELDLLRKENEALKLEVRKYAADHERLMVTIERIKKESRKLGEDLQNARQVQCEVKKESDQIKKTLLEDNSEKTKQIEGLKKELSQRDTRIHKILAELSEMHQKYEAQESSRERQMEMLHQLQVLRQEKMVMNTEKDALKQQHKLLYTDLNSLKDSMQETRSELRNEQWRHSVLTKEFNSLLNENNRLKTQLRQRLISTSKSFSENDTSSVTVMRPHKDRPLTKRHTYSSISSNQSCKSYPALPVIYKTESNK